MEQRKTIGIIGDGQLALMLADALKKMGTAFYCLTAGGDSPMQEFYPERVLEDAQDFVSRCDRFTLENEFHSVMELEELLGAKASGLFPALSSYRYFSNKIAQRMFFQSLGISSPKWLALRTTDDLGQLKNFSYPFVLKTSRGGYDGKGVKVVHSETELNSVLTLFQFAEGNELLIEEKIDIKTEVARGFLRNQDGHYTLLPLVETVQEDGVCNLVRYPAEVSESVSQQIEFALEKMIQAGLTGIFNFEFFVDKSNRLYINEGAPRTHNSQHLTMDAAAISQFDLLALYLTNPEVTPKFVEARPSAMINILGKNHGAYGELELPVLQGIKVHSKLYGKKKSSPGRKLGHVNIIDDGGKNDLLALGRKILREYKI